MSEEERQKNYYNCFLDLRRSAVAFYLNPGGSTHRIFLTHAKKILSGINSDKAKKFMEMISSLEDKFSNITMEKTEKVNLADKILTTGILMLE